MKSRDKILGMIDPSSMRKMGAGVASKGSHVLAQMVANSLDAHATEIRIQIDGRGRWLECTDNGEGMRPQDWPAFIGMGNPSKALDADAIGENGTGHTANWTAFNRTDVWTGWTDDPHCHYLSFSYEQAFALSLPGADGGINHTSTPKTDVKARVQGTGTVIRLSQPWNDPAAIRVLPGEVRRNLARMLSPWQLDMVTVNDEPLPSEFPKGEFCRKILVVEKVGQVELIAGYANRSVGEAARSWGTWGAHVCNHDQLLDQLPEAMRSIFPPEFSFPEVWFMIRVHGWKKFEGQHRRDYFKESLFRDEMFELAVRAVVRELLPEIRKRSHIIEDSGSTESEVLGRVMERLVETLGKTPPGDKNPTPRPRQEVLRLTPARITLVCEQPFTFHMNTDPDATYRINASESGGAIVINGKPLTGSKAVVDVMGSDQEIKYLAGNETGRRYALRVTRILTDGTEGETARATIRLEQSNTFALSPQILNLREGETAEVRVVNDDGLSGFTWSFRGEGGHVSPQSDGRSALVTAPVNEGSYTVVCQSSNGSRAETRVIVARDEGDKPDLTRQTRLQVDGVTFTVAARATGESLAGTPIPLSWSLRGSEGRSYVIMIGFQSAVARLASREGWLERLIEGEVVQRIASAILHEQGIVSGFPPTIEDVMVKRDALTLQLLK